MIRVKEREVTFGKPDTYPSFGWDADYGNTRVKLAAVFFLVYIGAIYICLIFHLCTARYTCTVCISQKHCRTRSKTPHLYRHAHLTTLGVMPGQKIGIILRIYRYYLQLKNTSIRRTHSETLELR